VLPKRFVPETTGRDYELSPYVADLAEFRDEFTVISGLSHPDVQGGHSTENCFLTSVREVESRLHSARQWELRPKPTTDQSPPDDIRGQKLFFEKFDLMLSMARLALESDSTRIVTLMVDAFATPVFKLHPDQNTTDGYRNLSHHGQAEDKVKQLADADHQQMALLGKLFGQLAATREGDARLLDRTMVLFGSNMGDANTHDNTNLPILLAGGGLRHGQHLAFPRERNRPLCDLFVTMLEQLGVEADAFGSSGGTLNELLG